LYLELATYYYMQAVMHNKKNIKKKYIIIDSKASELIITKLKKYQNDKLEGCTRYCCKNMRWVVIRGEIPIELANS